MQALEKTFRRSYRLGRCISFDEGMVQTERHSIQSSVEVHCGKKNEGKEQNVGPKAVVRNITKVLRGQPYKRLIITDNYYSTIQLSIKLFNMGLYHVATVRKARLG
ncbi:Hypothetical protein PHPALM_8666 [Phytophthora palmivora]|uniref:PiggyBac transposable element-derived protein domain-containing protein n=1 Tax=Phytophthora palmivora TaxID=4796 RepID=A0A2P4Y997_9STRA|nr:Hypothetical protein PHPALM_8666 [Phytophthora palmivora]